MMATDKLRIWGGEGNRSGIMVEGDILTNTPDGVEINELWREFVRANTVYNEHKQGFVGILSYAVLSDIELVPQIGDFSFEVATEQGIPRGQNTNISYYQLAYAYQDYDLRLGYTSIHYFSKSFNMKYHMSPSEFVKQNLQNKK